MLIRILSIIKRFKIDQVSLKHAEHCLAVRLNFQVDLALKGPKREIFGLGIFAQIRPLWIGYLGTRPKNPKKLRLGPYIALYFPRFLC
jgi:hypothetical protein